MRDERLYESYRALESRYYKQSRAKAGKLGKLGRMGNMSTTRTCDSKKTETTTQVMQCYVMILGPAFYSPLVTESIVVVQKDVPSYTEVLRLHTVANLGKGKPRLGA